MPVELVKAVRSLELSRIKTNHSLYFLDMIVSRLLIKKLQPDVYSPMGAKFLRKQFNSRYREWLSVLISEGVVECDNDYAEFRRKSLGYRISPSIVTNWADLEVVSLTNIDAFQPSESDRPYFQGLLDFLKTIEIDYSVLSSLIDNELPVENGSLNFKRYSWYRSIRLLQSGVVRASMSPVNDRLNTNFTNMPSILVEHIMKSNNLVEIDAKNSQFAILANMIKAKVNDDFVTDAICGVLYERLADKLDCSREEAKDLVMKTIYSKHYHDNKTKRIMTRLYPESMAIIEKYKRKSSNRELAIAMQQKESEIYIDGVLRKLHEIGVPAISKHDSIIFHRRDLKTVESVIRDTLETMDIQLELKVPNS
ncbi:hypothetical protein [Flagellimonas onchidii]|uniref:hypothetical protein n=1 Tax=Flagellimonas onchidii TaxID=2562684 RepID=UPI0010A645A6|nr:hypothetical protein [Allomuricauda onchidii]